MTIKEVQKNLYLGNIDALNEIYESDEPAVIFSFLEDMDELEIFFDENEITESAQITHYFVQCPDNPKQFDAFEKAFFAIRDNVKSALENNSKVLIHCRQGLHRSPVILALVLIVDFGLSYDEIFKLYGLGTYLSLNKRNLINYQLPENVPESDLPTLELVTHEKKSLKIEQTHPAPSTRVEASDSDSDSGNESEEDIEQDKKLARKILIICLCVPISWVPLALFWLVNTIKHKNVKAPARVWNETIENVFSRKWSKSPIMSETHKEEDSSALNSEQKQGEAKKK